MGDSPVFVMAGHIAPLTAWNAFNVDWDAALKTHPRLQYFKMREAWAREDEFKNWTMGERDERLNLLAPIITKHVTASVSFVVSTSAWKKHIVGKLSHRYHDRPYFFAFYGIMAALVKYLRAKGIEDKVDFIFDNEGGESASVMLGGFEEWASLAPEELKRYIGNPPIYRDEKSVLPLQAADFFAWHIRRANLKASKGERADDLTVAHSELLKPESITSLWGEKDVKQIEEFARSRRQSERPGITMSLPDPSSPLRDLFAPKPS